MPEQESMFSDEYQSGGTQTSPTQESVTLSSDTVVEMPPIENDKYGINKPKRIVIRAKIIK